MQACSMTPVASSSPTMTMRNQPLVLDLRAELAAVRVVDAAIEALDGVQVAGLQAHVGAAAQEDHIPVGDCDLVILVADDLEALVLGGRRDVVRTLNRVGLARRNQLRLVSRRRLSRRGSGVGRAQCIGTGLGDVICPTRSLADELDVPRTSRGRQGRSNGGRRCTCSAPRPAARAGETPGTGRPIPQSVSPLTTM